MGASTEPEYALLRAYLRRFASIPQAYQENTFCSLVSISEEKEWVTKTLQKPPSSGDAIEHVAMKH